MSQTPNYYQKLAKKNELTYLSADKLQISPGMLHKKFLKTYMKLKAMPIGKKGEAIIVATSELSLKNITAIKKYWGHDVILRVTPIQLIFSKLHTSFPDVFSKEIDTDLVNKYPELSSKKVFCLWQKIALLMLLIGLCIFMVINHEETLFWMLLTLEVGVSFTWIYKLFLVIGTFFSRQKPIVIPKKMQQPFYTILLPLLDEGEATIRNLVNALNKLEYDVHKLDIKFLVDNDIATEKILRKLDLPYYMQIYNVPRANFHSKPRACNYGLKWAVGEYLVIYDAEDKPGPLQLQKALYAFSNFDENTACVQAELNFYNKFENFLTKSFTVEYMVWHGVIFKMMSRLKLPVPIGGTSNHFKVSVLEEVGAWDPVNVTEDADIGIRLYRFKYLVCSIPSTTYEEANTRLGNWITQRTRWVKGFMQTYLVHMRNPFKLLKELGLAGFLNFQIIIGGSVFANLACLILWMLFIGYLLFHGFFIHNHYEVTVLRYAWINLVIGNIAMIAMNVLVVIRNRMFSLICYALLSPIYWILMGVASYRALYQIFVKPFHWEKTDHGISKEFFKKRK
ncbi:MAG: glycosyl transferase [Thiotrichales bacterium]|nr:MAG: glycosyl transferase [Thiotrichales bacterium]